MGTDELPMTTYLRFASGPMAGRIVALNKPVMTIGRDLDNDIVAKADLQVSRQHARFVWTQGAWRVEKLSHGNTLLVNGEPATAATLSAGMIVSLGETTSFTVLAAGEQAGAQTPAEPEHL